MLVAFSSPALAQDVQTFEVDDSLEAELLRPDAELLMPAHRGSSVRHLDRVLARADLSPLRRAQLLLQRADRARVRAFELREQSLQEQLQTQQVEDLEERARADTERATVVLEQALQTRPLPYSRETGQSMWSWMHSLMSIGQHQRATEVATLLVQECSTCPVAANAYVYLADRAFAEASLTQARVGYLAATNVRRAQRNIRAYAHYKLAWTELNLNDEEAALAHFFQARQLGARALKREAARDAMHALARTRLTAQELVGRTHQLTEDPAERDRLLDALERLLHDTGLTQRANEISRVRNEPNAPD